MDNPSFSTILIVDAPPHEVFSAINQVRRWWSENIEGDTDRAGSEFRYHYQNVHRARIKIATMEPDRKVVWHILDNYFKFNEDQQEWTGTDVVFALQEEAGKTRLTFTHEGLVPEYACYELCREAWTHYIQDSLKALITTGQGKPTPKDDTVYEGMEAAEGVTTGKSICHRLLIKAPVEKVYAALSSQEGLAGWWTPDTVAQPVTGSIARFSFGDYTKEMQIETLQPYSKVEWLCLKAVPEWIGTRLRFTLDPHQKGCVLSFRHEGWKDYTPEFASCSFDWALFFRSLRLLCETGKGLPYPHFDQ